ncbi:MAG: FAD-dependent oxidoreductase [Bacilli bacterium]|nr:FAD-dependent oxidoreductase [Bacilli bacterium]
MYDCIIIGGGISGLTASLYLARAGIKTLVLEESVCGGQILNAQNIENYPGVNSINGFELINNLTLQVKSYDCVDLKYEKVISIDNNSVTSSSNVYETKTIIIACGLKKKTLGLEHEEELIGSGISYCASCDGAFFKGRDVAVVGGGNTALDDVLYLSKIVNKVYLIIRREEFRGDKVLVDRINSLDNVEIIKSSKVTSLIGKPLNRIELNNNRLLDVSGLFIAIGSSPNTEFIQGLINLDDEGYIISEDTKTNAPNIFASGDIRTKGLRQLVTAASDGAIAANNVIQYLHN